MPSFANDVDHNIWGVYQEDVKLLELAGGGSVINWATLLVFIINVLRRMVISVRTAETGIFGSQLRTRQVL